MAIFGGLLDLVLLIFLVLVFAEYTKMRAKMDKQFKFIAGAAVLFLLAYSFMAGTLAVWGMVSGIVYAQYLFEFIGWIFLLIGTLWAAVEFLKK